MEVGFCVYVYLNFVLVKKELYWKIARHGKEIKDRFFNLGEELLQISERGPVLALSLCNEVCTRLYDWSFYMFCTLYTVQVLFDSIYLYFYFNSLLNFTRSLQRALACHNA